MPPKRGASMPSVACVWPSSTGVEVELDVRMLAGELEGDALQRHDLEEEQRAAQLRAPAEARTVRALELPVRAGSERAPHGRLPRRRGRATIRATAPGRPAPPTRPRPAPASVRLASYRGKELLSAEHPLELRLPLLVAELLDSRVRRVAGRLLDPEVTVGERGDLRQVRDRHDLSVLGEPPEQSADGVRRLAADARRRSRRRRACRRRRPPRSRARSAKARRPRRSPRPARTGGPRSGGRGRRRRRRRSSPARRARAARRRTRPRPCRRRAARRRPRRRTPAPQRSARPAARARAPGHAPRPSASSRAATLGRIGPVLERRELGLAPRRAARAAPRRSRSGSGASSRRSGRARPRAARAGRAPLRARRGRRGGRTPSRAGGARRRAARRRRAAARARAARAARPSAPRARRGRWLRSPSSGASAAAAAAAPAASSATWRCRSRSVAQPLLLARLHALGVLDERAQLGEPRLGERRVRRQLVVPAPRGLQVAPRRPRRCAAGELLLAAEAVEHLELVRRPREPALLELARHRDHALDGGGDVLPRSGTSPGVRARPAVGEDAARDDERVLVLRPQLRELLELVAEDRAPPRRTPPRRPRRRTSRRPSRRAGGRAPGRGSSCRRPSRR